MSRSTAASHTRVSAGDQKPLIAQLEGTRRFADEQGIREAREYEDEGNGGATDDRPGLQRMIADALSAEKPFDTNNRIRPRLLSAPEPA